MACRLLGIVGFLVLTLLLARCATVEALEWKIPEWKIPGSKSPCNPSTHPRQSPEAEATECLYLASNVDCEFSVDGQPMIKGNRVRILVTKGSHRVVCKPDGYRAKEDFIRPPFDPYHPIGFTFMLEDRLPMAGR
jgi:hypothetical protein